MLKKILVKILLIFLLLNNLQIGVIYAEEVRKLEEVKGKSEEILDKVDDLLDKATEKLEKNLKDKKQKEKLQEKKEEIDEAIEKAKEEIRKENKTKDITKIVVETQKKVILKVVSGVTQTVDLKEDLEKTIDKKEALKILKKSLEQQGSFNLIIKTSYTKEKALKLFKNFDKTIKVNYLYTSKNKNYFDVYINKKSIFAQEILGDLENFEIPKNFLAIEILKPELLKIEDININGENLEKTWGIKKYNPKNYLEKIKEKYSKQDGFRSLKIGVVDTGIDYNHPELKGKVLKGYDFVNNDEDAYDDQGHGTHVSGIIGANLNGKGILGVNPYIKLVPLKICTQSGYCPSYAVIKALDYIENSDIDIVNMSLGGRGDPKTNAICSGIEAVTKKGKIVVVASGNSNINTRNFVPGGCEEASSR